METLHTNPECKYFGELKSTFPCVLYWLAYEYTQTHSLSSTPIPAVRNRKPQYQNLRHSTDDDECVAHHTQPNIKPNWADGLTHSSQHATRNWQKQTTNSAGRQHPQQPERTLNSIKFSGFRATAIGVFDLPANMP